MSTNQVKGHPGRKFSITAPTGGLTAGNLHALRTGASGWSAVVEKGAAAGDAAVLIVGGIVEVPKNTGTGESFAVGALVYHDASTHKATAVATGNDLAGAAVEAATTSGTTVLLALGSPA